MPRAGCWPQGRAADRGQQVRPKEAATAAEKLIVRDKVPVIVGAWGSSMTLAAMPKLEEYGVPMIVETSSAATITKRGNRGSSASARPVRWKPSVSRST